MNKRLHSFDSIVNKFLLLQYMAEFLNTSIDYVVSHIKIKQSIEHTERYALNKKEAALIEKYRKLNNKAQSSIIVSVVDSLLESAK